MLDYTTLNPALLSVHSFIVTTQGDLFTIQEKSLNKLDQEINQFDVVANLPTSNMGMSEGKNALYLYDNTKSTTNHAIYKLSSNNDYIKIIDVPTPVNAVLEVESYVTFATQNKLYAIDIANKALKEIAVLKEDNDEIISIAFDRTMQAFYFSTQKAIFRIKDSDIACVNDQFGGMLQCDDLGLLIFNPHDKFVVRLRNNALYSNVASVSNSKPNTSTMQTATPKQEAKPVKSADLSSYLSGNQNLTFTVPTTLHSTSGDQYTAQPDNYFEGMFKEGKIVAGKLYDKQGGKVIKIFIPTR
jgi:CMP-2-keto-3-deoxyoctulosonic acid synthetase